jgi:hypothetical protein
MEQEFVAMAKTLGNRAKLEAAWVPDAMEALTAGDAAQHDHLIAVTAPRLAHCDVVLLAQFSMARALPMVCQAIGQKVLTSPDSAVVKLKALLSNGAGT